MVNHDRAQTGAGVYSTMTSDLHWVFAYGSNMHLPDLKRWLGAQGCSKTGIHQITPAILEGFELVWNYWSPVRQGGAVSS